MIKVRVSVNGQMEPNGRPAIHFNFHLDPATMKLKLKLEYGKWESETQLIREWWNYIKNIFSGWNVSVFIDRYDSGAILREMRRPTA